MSKHQKVKIQTQVAAPLSKVWDCFTHPKHITQWNAASPDWHTPKAENDLRLGGSFLYRMEAKDGSMGFDFGGVYDKVLLHKEISYTLGDGRKVSVHFEAGPEAVQVEEEFETEDQNPVEMQQQGWQAILDNFKHYAEKH